MPLCLTDSCDCLINKRVNLCFAGSRMGFLEFTGCGALFSLPLHLIRPLSKNNPNCVTYVGGVDLWSLLRRNAISLKKNDPWTDWIQQHSASFNSTALNVNCSFSAIFTLATWFLKDLAALIMRVVTRSNFVRLQNRLISTIWSMFLSGRLAEVLTSEWTVACALLTTSLSTTSSLDWVVRFSGHSVSGRYRNCGPFHHVLQVTRTLAVKPHKARSAGFKWLGQCRHASLGVRLRISSTWCWTYCFQILWFLIQHNAVIESVQ